MREIFVARNMVEAELVADQLRAMGFDPVVRGDSIVIPSGKFPSVWVPDEQGSAAEEAWQQLDWSPPEG